MLKSYTENQSNFDSSWYELSTDSINEKQFRVRKKTGGRYPRLFISPPFIVDTNEKRIFINIHEEHNKTLTIVYCLEFDSDNNIFNWCRTEHQRYIEY